MRIISEDPLGPDAARHVRGRTLSPLQTQVAGDDGFPGPGASTAAGSGDRGRLQAFGATDRGNVRPRNEDAFLVATLERSTRVLQGAPTTLTDQVNDASQVWLLAVADGMGGQPGGEMASRVALTALVEATEKHLPFLQTERAPSSIRVHAELERAVRICQNRVREQAEREGMDGVPGTTLTAAFIRWPHLYVAHAGDSRCYLLRDGSLRQLTHDHTLAAELGKRADGTGARSATLEHILCNAVGGDGSPVEVEQLHLKLAKGDVLLLCSDGVYGYVDDIELSELMSAVSRGRRTSEACVHDIVQLANGRGGGDNITAVIATVVG